MSLRNGKVVAATAKIANGRSRITNGKDFLLPGVDGRTPWARRFRDLIDTHVTDLGGETEVSAAERSLLRRAAALTVELELLEYRFATRRSRRTSISTAG